MKVVFHKSLNQESWNEKKIDYQILTICAEFGRAKNMIKKQNIQEVKNCMERALELLDLTKCDPKWKSRLKELLRLRELTGDFYLNDTFNIDYCLKLYKCLLQFHHLTANIQI